jgi:hypothetical protein
MMTMDNKNYHVGTPLPRFEYMIMSLPRLPEEIVDKYNLSALAVEGWIHIEIRKGMNGLKQAGLFSNQLLQTRLAPFGYYPARHIPGLWLYRTRTIAFSIIVDDFYVKYSGKQHPATNWASKVYSGMSLNWDRNSGFVTFPCLAMFQTCSANFNMMPLSIHNTQRPDTSRRYMGPKLSMQQKMKDRLSRPNNA